MVLQQKQANPIWGWDTPGTKVTVTFAGQSKTAAAGADGKWTVKLDPVPANATAQSIKISAGAQNVELKDVLVGEVWMCSGQSNMQMNLGGDWNGDLEAQAAHFPNVRLISVPQVGTQELQNDFKGQWTDANPQSTPGFSAVGYLFGRYIHQVVGVPVGLINNAWGGSSAEAWVRRDTIEKDPRFAPLMETTVKSEAYNSSEKAKADFEEKMAQYKEAAGKAKAEGKPVPRPPTSPESWLKGQHRLGNIFAGVVHPTLGYGIKGVIWYQGETNAGRAWEYGQLFPFMIEEWRKEWNNPNLPFYWVQLADYMKEEAKPGESAWAELRESQTKTMSLPNTGQAVIIDLGEGKDIHPKNKHDVAARLVRWALAKDYGIKIPFHSPEYKSLEIKENKAIVTINCFGSALRAFDVEEAIGFAVCGEDKVWHWAKGKVLGNDKVELTCEAVAKPIAVRYAWANNPACNLSSQEGLPLTPFRTDDFEMTTKPKAPEAK
jgi:sialate O-acetylesterase